MCHARTAIYLLLALALVAPAVAQDDDWAALSNDCDLAFTPPPVKRMFGDPMRELKLNRRAPYTKAARQEIQTNRAKARLMRSQILDERRKREALVARVAAFGGERGARRLIRIYEMQLGHIEIATKNRDKWREAGRIDINPGVDPGGVYWDRWMSKYEIPAAGRVVADERKLRDLALEGCAKLMTPEIATWLLRMAESHEDNVVREQMIAVLAKSGKPENAAALGRIFQAEPLVWVRVTILDDLAAAKAPGAEPFVMRALADEAWPVRSAAYDAIRDLWLAEVETVDALVAAMAEEDGRLRLEVRQLLAALTGQTFGLEPEEWKLWWGANRETWSAPAAAVKVEPFTEGLPRFCGRATASKRIAFVISRGKHMLEPAKRRPVANDGTPSPEPAVDTAMKVAAWELEETLASLPGDALFTVIVVGREASVWSKKLRRPTRDQRKAALRFVRKWKPEGVSFVSRGASAALRLGIPSKIEDIALGGAGDVDTIFTIGGSVAGQSNSLARSFWHRVRRLRRVVTFAPSPAVK